jgi:anti-sigma regulatory factor (Ser/Thr protein kinase)
MLTRSWYITRRWSSFVTIVLVAPGHTASGWLNGVALFFRVTQQTQTWSDEVAESYPAVPDSVPRARSAVVGLAAEAGATSEQIDAIRLATSEALTNAVVHAYVGAPGEVHVSAAIQAGGLEVIVADDGRGPTPRVNRSSMGLGLALMAEAADKVAILKRPGGGTEVQMRFAVSSRS